MISTHLTKNTWLHQIPGGIKLLTLSFTTVFSIFINDVVFALTFLIFVLLLFSSLGKPGFFKLKKLLKSIGIMILIICLFQLFFVKFEHAILISLKMLTLILLADLISITTPMVVLKSVILQVLRPISFLGLNTKNISLTMTLSLRLIQLYIVLWKRLDLSLKSRTSFKHKSSFKSKFNNYKIKKLTTPFLLNAHNLTIHMADSLKARMRENT